VESIYPNRPTASNVRLQSRLFPRPEGSRTTTGKNTARGLKKWLIMPVPPDRTPLSLSSCLCQFTSSMLSSLSVLELPGSPEAKIKALSLVLPFFPDIRYAIIARSLFSLSSDSGNTNVINSKLMNEQATATQKTEVTDCLPGMEDPPIHVMG
jgi:hypothetical protein